MESAFLVVLATVADPETGAALAKTLVDERLAACVQVIPGGTSIYRWQGALYTEPQVQLIIKTSSDAWPSLRSRWMVLHGDEVPELLALPVSDGLPAYMNWLKESTTPVDHHQGK
jgi:periplasmic divalent cation tolerance protein